MSSLYSESLHHDFLERLTLRVDDGTKRRISSAAASLKFSNPFVYLVGRPGLDLGTLGVILPSTGPSLIVQICWSNEVGRSPTSSEILPSLISWLDEWLDQSSYTGLANALYKSSGESVVEIRLGVD